MSTCIGGSAFPIFLGGSFLLAVFLVVFRSCGGGVEGDGDSDLRFGTRPRADLRTPVLFSSREAAVDEGLLLALFLAFGAPFGFPFA
jgi:hypothetical protein